MQPIHVIADKALPPATPGNQLTITADLVPGKTLNSEFEIGMSIVVNDGQAATENSDDVPDTEIYFRLPLSGAQELSAGINELIEESVNQRTAILAQALEFKSAQLSCAKGIIGALQVVKIGDSDRAGVGFGFYDLIYMDDSGDNAVIHTVEEVECYVPFTEEEQYEWLRALVGGNHQFTASIKISLEGFSLESVRDEFHEKLAQHHREHHSHE